MDRDQSAEHAASITSDFSACFSKVLITSWRPLSSVTILALFSLTDKLHNAPQQFPAISELLGKARKAARMSCTPPSLPITSAALSDDRRSTCHNESVM